MKSRREQIPKQFALPIVETEYRIVCSRLVIANHNPFTPAGVAMAGFVEFDPYEEYPDE